MNKNEELLPYYEKARDTLDYNSDTGIFTWKYKKGSVKVGKEAGRINSRGYGQIGITINGEVKRIYSHRLAYFVHYGKLPNIIDHINGDKAFNCISNLRSCTQQENTLNQGKRTNNKSGYKGVFWCKQSNKWRARIWHIGKQIHLGLFNCPKEASIAYETKAKELRGEFYAEKS